MSFSMSFSNRCDPIGHSKTGRFYLQIRAVGSHIVSGSWRLGLSPIHAFFRTARRKPEPPYSSSRPLDAAPSGDNSEVYSSRIAFAQSRNKAREIRLPLLCLREMTTGFHKRSVWRRKPRMAEVSSRCPCWRRNRDYSFRLHHERHSDQDQRQDGFPPPEEGVYIRAPYPPFYIR